MDKLKRTDGVLIKKKVTKSWKDIRYSIKLLNIEAFVITLVCIVNT